MGQLGNTYPFTENDWHKTFALAEETGLSVLYSLLNQP
jgi:hypothetical protein